MMAYISNTFYTSYQSFDYAPPSIENLILMKMQSVCLLQQNKTIYLKYVTDDTNTKL